MLLGARTATWGGKRLPYDAEVEYLESTGTQWIDTGVFGNLHTRIEIVIEKTNNIDELAVCGFFLSGSLAQITLPANKSYNGLYARFGDKYITSGMVVSQGWHTLTSDRAGFTIDGVSRGTFGATADFTTPGSLAIFRFKGLDRNFFNGRIYSCKFYDGDTLVRDYIPVRVGTVGYLYDRASGALFGNAGTGDFVLGQDVVPVEYIESHGTEYINTGYSSTGVGIRAKVSCEKTTSATSEMSIVGRNISDGFDLYFSGGKCALWNKSGGNITSNVAIVANTRYSINAAIHSSGGSLSVNGESKTSSFSPATPSAADIVILRHNNRYYFVGKIYDCELYDNDALVRKFLPVRVGTDATSWEGAMMDTLTRRIYRNAGTGAFTYGNDV